MSQKLNIKNLGLHTAENQASIPDGSLQTADNIVIDNGIAESRRGFKHLSNSFSSDDNRCQRITEYQGKLISYRSDDSKLCYNNSGWNDYSGTYSHPDSDYAKMRFVQANQNLYFTTSEGVKVLDSYNGTIYNTGMAQGLDGSGSTTGASGFMTDNTQIAYRVVWGARDANNNLYLGAPSQRIIVSNSSGGTRDVSLTFTIPDGITTGDFYQVYRSKESASSTSEPNDELQLVYEENPTSGEITAKSITFTDSTPTSLMGAYLYTNSSQEGIQESNNEPPFAHDIEAFKNFMFFANTKTKHKLNIKLISVSGSSGLVVNDTITINSMVFTAKASTTVAAREFKVFTAGSASQNIDDTARELVKVINQYTSNTSIYAYYTTGYSDLPGQILLSKRTVDDTSFTVSVSRSSAWNIDDGTSDNEVNPNYLMWSKYNQPEHTPAAHFQPVGSKSHPIRRIVALRDSLFIFKDDGIFKLTGSDGQWVIAPLDTSTVLLAPDSAVAVNNQIMALTNQGIVSVSDVGVQVLSEPIKDEITELIGLNYDALKTLSFGIGYETDRKYILSTITNTNDTYCTQSFVMNMFTQQWTKYKKDIVCGVVSPTDDKLYLGSATDKYILQERKDFSFTDYVDEELLGYSIVSSSDYDVVLNTISGLTVGDLLYDSTNVYSPIVSIDASTSTVTLNDIKTWSVGSITILKAIDCKVEYSNQSCNNPGLEKHFQELTLLFQQKSFNSATVDFYTDVSGGYSSVSLTGDFGGGLWGNFAWGSIPWGGIIRPKPIRVSIPRNKSRGTLISIRFSHRVGYGQFGLQGLSLQYSFTSERVES